jgi:alkylhydroperoxidase family enzyme
MEPMYLPDVEQAPGGGPWAEAIQGMRAAGLDVPQILHLFAFKTDRTEHLARFTQGVMRGPSPLSPGQRELIAAFTSRRNACPF